MNTIIILILVLSNYNSYEKPSETFSNFFDGVSDSLVNEIESNERLIDTELEWLDQLLLSNGAVATRGKNDGEVTVNPYFANSVAKTLIEASVAYQEAVKNYMKWYLNHLNDDGSIYDYNIVVKNDLVYTETSKQTYDSIDSYAATFLSLVGSYLTETGDIAYINTNIEAILKVSDALLMTRYHGLTVNQFEDYNQYLMDNMEVYEACSAMLRLLNSQGLQLSETHKLALNKGYSDLYKSIPERIEAEMWDDHGFYHFVLFKDNTPPKSFDWRVFYPDAIAQIYPIMYGLIPPNSERAKLLYDSFNQSFKWEELDYIENKDDTFLWSQLSYTAVLMNDMQRFNRYKENYYRFIGDEREYPYFSENSVWLVKACRIRIDKNQRLLSTIRLLEKWIDDN